MPCNRRYQNQQQHGCHRGAWRQAHFPEASLFAAFLAEHHDGDDDAALHPACAAAWNHHKNNKARSTSSDDEAHVLRMDVPGVKADRISIDEKNGEIEITALRMNGEEVAKVYQEVFYLNPFRFDIDQAMATLTNGVLTLSIPKMEGSLKMVSVEAASAPSDLPSNIFQHTLDLPGVPASSLEVKLVEDRVHMVGKRSLGDNKRVLVQRSFEVPPSMDTLQARALLQDGVFTFLAPIHETTEEAQLRTIFVQEAMEVEAAAMAEMKIADEEMNYESKTKGDDTMKEDDGDANVVETVDEAAEAKDTDSWQEVPSDEKK